MAGMSGSRRPVNTLISGRLFPTSYLFDIFLGPSYNQSPPSVKYMTVRESLYLG